MWDFDYLVHDLDNPHRPKILASSYCFPTIAALHSELRKHCGIDESARIHVFLVPGGDYADLKNAVFYIDEEERLERLKVPAAGSILVSSNYSALLMEKYRVLDLEKAYMKVFA